MKTLFAIFVLAIAGSISGAPNQYQPKDHIHNVTIGQAPWQVSLESSGRHICGGAIISNRWIITAARCLPESVNEWDDLKIRVGTTNKEAGGQLFDVNKVVIHPRYVHINFDYDFGLVQLDDVLEFIESIQPIQLPEKDSHFAEGTPASVSGWGAGKASKALQGLNVLVGDREQCSKHWSVWMHVPDRMICTHGVAKNAKFAENPYQCTGYAGGPLVTSHITANKPVLVGTVSWGNTCSIGSDWRVYARTAAVRDWIQSQTGI